MRDMLSVKAAIERVIEGQSAVCLEAVKAKCYDTTSYERLAEAVEKFVASLYVSGQIDRTFSVIVYPMQDRRIRVDFSVRGHISYVDYTLPIALKTAQPPAASPCTWVSHVDPIVASTAVEPSEETVDVPRSTATTPCAANSSVTLPDATSHADYERAKKYTC